MAQQPVPIGPEFRVNTLTSFYQANPSIALDADGGFVVVWGHTAQNGVAPDVYAQRYNASGAAIGGEFRVNTHTTGGQDGPSLAMDADGDFVVVWVSEEGDGDSYGVFAQRYDASGVAVGGEFRVNSYTTSMQGLPSVAMDADGDFVVAWESFGQDSSDRGVYAQRYSATGVARGLEFQVNTYTQFIQGAPSIASDADGDFVIVWESWQDGSERGVFAQRFASDGAPRGAEFQVNAYTANDQSSPAVAMDADGDFVVVWRSFGQDGDRFGVYAQRYDASGVALGGEVRVNAYTTNVQGLPSVAMDADGDFVVAWQSFDQDGYNYGIFARNYAAAGGAQGQEVLVNTYTMSDQMLPAVAADAEGDFVVAWQSMNQDGDFWGVYAQRYRAGTVASEPAPEGGLALMIAPSPVAASGRIRYDVPEAGPARLSLHDVLGREVAVLAEGTVAAGAHEATFDAAALAPGAYVLRLEAGADVRTRRITVAH